MIKQKGGEKIINSHNIKGLNKSYIRELEMTLDIHSKVGNAIVIQFFKDLDLYGLDEAFNYVKNSYTPKYYNKEVIGELEEIIGRIKSDL